jgi:hypothetical protein
LGTCRVYVLIRELHPTLAFAIHMQYQHSRFSLFGLFKTTKISKCLGVW